MRGRPDHGIAEPSPAGIRRARDHRVGAEDTTPWVWEGPPPIYWWRAEDMATPEEERIDPLDMAQCWREGCYHYVPMDDDLGLCPQCVAYLRTL